MNMYTQRIHAVAIYGNTRANKNHGRNTEGNHATILQLTTSEKASKKCLMGCAICQKFEGIPHYSFEEKFADVLFPKDDELD